MSQINRVPAGGYLGELALVTHKPRAASAYAVGDIKLACKFVSLTRFSLRLRIGRLANNTAVCIGVAVVIVNIDIIAVLIRVLEDISVRLLRI